MAARRHGWPLVILVAILNSLVGPWGWVRQTAAQPPCASPCAWAGIYPTVLAPFCDHGGIDVASLERQLHYELSGGVHGLLVLGTIGEGQYASWEERAQMIATAVRVAEPAVPVVVGIHTCNLDVARAQLMQAKELGAAAVLVKYIGRPGAPAPYVLGFMSALSEMHELPIFYYHYPSQTGLKLTPAEVAAILGLPGVVGIKESTLNLREMQTHVCLTRGQGKVFLSGTALNLTQFLEAGGHGAMCPEAVLLPGPTVAAYNAYVQGRHEEARNLQKQLFAVTPILRARSTSPTAARVVLMTAQDHKIAVPIGRDQPQARLKAALNCLGIPTPTAVKCPLPPLTPREQRRVEEAVARLRHIDWCEAVLDIPPEPLSGQASAGEWGMLLKTGSLLLGPNVGRDLLRTQWDGHSGF